MVNWIRFIFERKVEMKKDLRRALGGGAIAELESIVE